MPTGVYERKRTPLPMRLLHRAASVISDDPDECWIWPGSRTSDGYGTINPMGQADTNLVHRLVFEMFHGPIPQGKTLDHVWDRGCTSKACFNPRHLEVVSLRENILRGDGMAARRAKQTHCVNGHELKGENLYISPKGGRQCRHCAREASRSYYQRRSYGAKEKVL